MKKFAVIGNPISHSLSPHIHHHFAKANHIHLTYEKILGDPIQFEMQVTDFFSEGGSGLNVTLPFKLRAFEMAEQKSRAALLAKAANVLMLKDGVLYADNTDGKGLMRDLGQYLNLQDKKVLVLGGGGAARGIIAPLLEARVSMLTVLVRDRKKSQDLSDAFPDIKIEDMTALRTPVDLIIHATSAGFSNNPLQLPDSLWQGRPLCYDLSYSKTGSTPFVELAKAQGLKALDGFGMLVEQAAEAFTLWHGVLISGEVKNSL